MKKAFMATGIAAISACSQPIDDEQREILENLVEDAEVMLPAVQEIVRAADPLVDAHGEDVADNEEVVKDITETVENVRFYFDNDRIRTWDNAKGENAGMFPHVLTPHSVEDDYIYLNAGFIDQWSASLLVHEAGHRYKLHSGEMDAYRRNDDNLSVSLNEGGDGGEAYMEKVLEEKDYPELVEHLFYAVNGPVYRLADVYGQHFDSLVENEADKRKSEYIESQADFIYNAFLEKTREDWAREEARVYFENSKMMTILGVDQAGLQEVLMTEGLHEHSKERLTEVYEEKMREFREGQEAAEAKRAEQRERGEGSRSRR